MKKIRLSKYFKPVIAVCLFATVMVWSQLQAQRLPSVKEHVGQLDLASVASGFLDMSDSVIESRSR